jgi:hypothetical protein
MMVTFLNLPVTPLIGLKPGGKVFPLITGLKHKKNKTEVLP